jgi:5-methylcytosine-specific restriction endonuclease McrA
MTGYKNKIKRRQGGLCFYCGGVLGSSEDPKNPMYPTLEHLLPRSISGVESEYPDNHVMVCRECNSMKGNKTVEHFLAKIRMIYLTSITPPAKIY